MSTPGLPPTGALGFCLFDLSYESAGMASNVRLSLDEHAVLEGEKRKHEL